MTGRHARAMPGRAFSFSWTLWAMGLRLLLIFVLVPLVEVALLSQLAEHAGTLLTVSLVLITGFVGASLAKRQGLSVWRQIHQEMAAGRAPSEPIKHGVMILLAGAFLITPGILTDVVGFSLLVPWCRTNLSRILSRWFLDQTRFRFGGSVVTPGGPFRPSSESPEAGPGPSVRVVDPTEQAPSPVILSDSATKTDAEKAG